MSSIQKQNNILNKSKDNFVKFVFPRKTYNVVSSFETRMFLEEYLNHLRGFKGKDRKSLYYFVFEDYFKDGVTAIPYRDLQLILLEAIDDLTIEDFSELDLKQAESLSDSLAVLIVQCFAGGDTAKKFLTSLIIQRGRKR